MKKTRDDYKVDPSALAMLLFVALFNGASGSNLLRKFG